MTVAGCFFRLTSRLSLSSTQLLVQDNRLAKLLVISETPGLEMVDQNASLEGNLIRIRL